MVITKHNEKFLGVRRSARLKTKAISVQGPVVPTIGPSLSCLRSIFTPDRPKRGNFYDGIVEMGDCLATSTPKIDHLKSSRVKQVQDRIKESILTSRPAVGKETGNSAKLSTNSENKLKNIEIEVTEGVEKREVKSAIDKGLHEVDPVRPNQDSSCNNSFKLAKKPRKYSKKKQNARPHLAKMKRVEDKVLQQFRPASRIQTTKLPSNVKENKKPKPPKFLSKEPLKIPQAAVSSKDVPKDLLSINPDVLPPQSALIAGLMAGPPLATVPAPEPIAYRDPTIPSSPIPSLPIPKSTKPTYLELSRKCARGPDPMNLLRPPQRCCCSRVRPDRRIQTPLK